MYGKVTSTVDCETNTELDSHAEQSLVGRNALIVHDYDRPINIVGYDPDGPVRKSLKTVSAALAYTLPETGETVILVIHQAVHHPTLDHHLLSPMQMRLNDVIVNDCPKFLTENPSATDHAIVVTGDTSDDKLVIPLSLKGVTSVFPTRKPSIQEFEACPHYDLTFDSPEYKPEDITYAEQESAMARALARLQETGDRTETRCLSLVTHCLCLVS